jgi:hypothetical protein
MIIAKEKKMKYLKAELEYEYSQIIVGSILIFSA